MKETRYLFNYSVKPGFSVGKNPLQGPENPFRSFEFRMKELKTMQAVVLAIWAVLNMAGGGVFIFLSTDQSFWLHFFAMNVSWGFINFGVAAFIYYHHNEIFQVPQSVFQQMDHQRHAEKMMVFNLGLDLAFVAVGWGLVQYARSHELPVPELWNGFGVAVVMQGVFLGMLDGVFHYLHVKNRRMICPEWKRRMEKELFRMEDYL